MKAAYGKKKTELMQRLLESVHSGIRPEQSDLKKAEQLGIDTEKIMEVFHVANDDDEGDG